MGCRGCAPNPAPPPTPVWFLTQPLWHPIPTFRTVLQGMQRYLETQCNLFSPKAQLAALDEYTNQMLIAGKVMQEYIKATSSAKVSGFGGRRLAARRCIGGPSRSSLGLRRAPLCDAWRFEGCMYTRVYAYTSRIRIYIYAYTQKLPLRAYNMPIGSTISRPRLLVVHSVYRLYQHKRVCAQCLQTMQSVYKLCTVSTDYTGENVYVHSVYRPPQCPQHNDFWNVSKWLGGASQSSASHLDQQQTPVLIRDDKIKWLDFSTTPDPENLQPHPGFVW